MNNRYASFFLSQKILNVRPTATGVSDIRGKSATRRYICAS